MGIGIHVQRNILFYLLLLVVGFGGFLFPILRPQGEGFYAFIVSAAIAGFGVASYVFYTKRSGKQLVCPAGSDCNAVVTSKYSVFLGVPIEYLGMAYYATVGSAYALLIIASHLLPAQTPLLLVLLSFGAFLFSLYLLVAQAFLLKQWCIWCLLSAVLSISIFIVSLVSIPAIVAVFGQLYGVFALLHLIGFFIGVGSATLATLVFMRFLRDFSISDRELKVLKGISEFCWLGLALIFTSELAMYLTNPQLIATSEVFWVKTIALFVATLTGAVLLVVLTPFLTMVPFSEGEPPSMLARVRRLIFLAGSVALVSWYFAFALTVVIETQLSYLLLGYGGLLLIAIVMGMVAERLLMGTKEEVAEASRG